MCDREQQEAQRPGGDTSLLHLSNLFHSEYVQFPPPTNACRPCPHFFLVRQKKRVRLRFPDRNGVARSNVPRRQSHVPCLGEAPPYPPTSCLPPRTFLCPSYVLLSCLGCLCSLFYQRNVQTPYTSLGVARQIPRLGGSLPRFSSRLLFGPFFFCLHFFIKTFVSFPVGKSRLRARRPTLRPLPTSGSPECSILE